MIGHVLTPLVINTLICSTIGVIDYRDLTVLPKWGFPQSMGVDLTVTSFLLPWITCLIATPLTHRDVRRGTVAPLTHDERLPFWLRPFDQPWSIRAPMIGLAGLLIAGTTALLILSLLPWSEASISRFLVAKVTLAALFGTLVTPPVALLAMHDRSNCE